MFAENIKEGEGMNMLINIKRITVLMAMFVLWGCHGGGQLSEGDIAENQVAQDFASQVSIIKSLGDVLGPLDLFTSEPRNITSLKESFDDADASVASGPSALQFKDTVAPPQLSESGDLNDDNVSDLAMLAAIKEALLQGLGAAKPVVGILVDQIAKGVFVFGDSTISGDVDGDASLSLSMDDETRDIGIAIRARAQSYDTNRYELLLDANTTFSDMEGEMPSRFPTIHMVVRPGVPGQPTRIFNSVVVAGGGDDDSGDGDEQVVTEGDDDSGGGGLMIMKSLFTFDSITAEPTSIYAYFAMSGMFGDNEEDDESTMTGLIKRVKDSSGAYVLDVVGLMYGDISDDEEPVAYGNKYFSARIVSTDSRIEIIAQVDDLELGEDDNEVEVQFPLWLVLTKGLDGKWTLSDWQMLTVTGLPSWDEISAEADVAAGGVPFLAPTNSYKAEDLARLLNMGAYDDGNSMSGADIDSLFAAFFQVGSENEVWNGLPEVNNFAFNDKTVVEGRFNQWLSDVEAMIEIFEDDDESENM